MRELLRRKCSIRNSLDIFPPIAAKRNRTIDKHIWKLFLPSLPFQYTIDFFPVQQTKSPDLKARAFVLQHDQHSILNQIRESTHKHHEQDPDDEEKKYKCVFECDLVVERGLVWMVLFHGYNIQSCFYTVNPIKNPDNVPGFF